MIFPIDSQKQNIKIKYIFLGGMKVLYLTFAQYCILQVTMAILYFTLVLVCCDN